MNMIPSIYKHLSMSATEPNIEFTLQNHPQQQFCLVSTFFFLFFFFFFSSLIQLSQERFFHYENTPIQIYWKIHHQKLKVFR